MLTMTKIELNTFRRTLNSRQSELGNGNRNREALTLETSPDELDRIQHAHERDYAIGNLERNSERLREVQTAIRRIDAGTFGICVECEENISSKRLAAVPWASSCIVCQEALDRGQEMRSQIDTSLVMAA
jgi:DnaK suppressor protein